MNPDPDDASGNSSDDIMALFDNAFSQPESSDAPAAIEEPKADPPVEAPEPETPATQPDQPQIPPLQVDPREIAELRGAVTALLQQPRAMPAQAPPQAPSMPEFPVEISQEIVEALGSDNIQERRVAVQALGSQLGQRVMQETTQLVSAALQRYVPQMIAQAAEQRELVRHWHDQFYNKYPVLGKTPQLKRFVSQVAAHMLQTGQLRSLDMAAFDSVAAQTLTSLGIQPRARANGGTPVAPAAGRPTTAARTARPSNPGQLDPNSPEGILDTWN